MSSDASNLPDPKPAKGRRKPQPHGPLPTPDCFQPAPQDQAAPAPMPDEPQPIALLPEDAAPVLTSFQQVRLRRLALEKARRKVEALRLYEPLPDQGEFHKSLAPERLLRGSNRGGKTLPAAVEVARAVTGQDPHDKYPKRDGRCFAVGKDGRHCAQVMWRKLSRAGAFKIIRDQYTREWRAYRPWDPCDRARIQETKPAPPLIPPRLIKKVAWDKKVEDQPSLIILHNGWEIAFFSSLGKPPNGNDIDLGWFDEEIVDPDWYPEVSARLLDRRGRFIWSATPQAGTEQLYNLHEEAERLAEAGAANPRVTEHVILLENNPYIDDDQKKELSDKLSEEDRAVRVGGEFVFLSFKVYPEFTPSAFICDWFDIPKEWTRYVSVDPGRQVCAVAFLAVPPPDDPEHGKHVYLYDELYIQNCDAEQFGQAMAKKCGEQDIFEFLIDHQGAQVHDTGSGRSVEEQYSAALARNKVASIVGGTNFTWGIADVEAGVEAFRAWLRDAGDGTRKLRVLRNTCPNFLHEVKYYRYKRVNGVITDKPEARGRVHQMANCRYLAMRNPRWVKPRPKKGAVGGALGALRAKQKKQKAAAGSQSIRLGPKGG